VNSLIIVLFAQFSITDGTKVMQTEFFCRSKKRGNVNHLVNDLSGNTLVALPETTRNIESKDNQYSVRSRVEKTYNRK